MKAVVSIGTCLADGGKAFEGHLSQGALGIIYSCKHVACLFSFLVNGDMRRDN